MGRSDGGLDQDGGRAPRNKESGRLIICAISETPKIGLSTKYPPTHPPKTRPTPRDETRRGTLCRITDGQEPTTPNRPPCRG